MSVNNLKRKSTQIHRYIYIQFSFSNYSEVGIVYGITNQIEILNLISICCRNLRIFYGNQI